MGKILDAIRARTWTRALPKSPSAQLNLVMRAEKGSTRAVAARLGVSQRTIQRWVKGEQQPSARIAGRLQEEAAKSHQPRVTARARRAAGAGGIRVETRATFGFRAAPGSTDDARLRRITDDLPRELAGRLWDAAAAGDESQLQRLVGEGLGHAYFRDGGRRADGLDVELTDIDYIDLDWNQ
ncbi:helix-turn-helix domain-containing protein [Streptomyces sp. NBC_00654]|uniref:telomere-protecting terminal protein Tpg n=1 Tax=Streptomyces sp. NBC_00654 TaxID=2975799 RepID=UPI00225B4F0A|nr:helix-turn-helix transcriptional regulator [Streptomyces sp. NBC_00654]MCX4971257.1 helix-turn-helix domain-containing protein [Streptomyces sp. NBC_00654]MCX4971260.1 helix-turn-helix domain-containing protein [Streptomyces sp. NBC_00654]